MLPSQYPLGVMQFESHPFRKAGMILLKSLDRVRLTSFCIPKELLRLTLILRQIGPYRQFFGHKTSIADCLWFAETGSNKGVNRVN